jgi:hypothetical protein
MKKKKLLILLFFISKFSYAQTIVNLKTFKEVATFLEKEVNKKYTFHSVFEGEDEIDQEDFNEVVQKIDIDTNGTIDLVIDYVGVFIVVLNKGNNEYQELKDVKYSMQLLSVTQINGKTFFIRKIKLPKYNAAYTDEIVIFDENGEEAKQTKEKDRKIITERGIKYKVDTLEVKFNSFVAFNKSASNEKNSIKEIQFKATSCFGSCPVFELKLTSNGTLTYTGKHFTNFIGQKKLQLSSEKVRELFGLIAYTNVKKLKDHYSINVTDNPSGILTVFFENGTVKEIYDYGRSGTYNLEVIYDKLMKISDSIK